MHETRIGYPVVLRGGDIAMLWNKRKYVYNCVSFSALTYTHTHTPLDHITHITGDGGRP